MSMLPMTKVEGCPDKREVRDGMAYFADTGPFATYCGDCKHRGYHRQRVVKGEERYSKTSGCAMFKKLTGEHGPPVDKTWPSCKYFERKK